MIYIYIYTFRSSFHSRPSFPKHEPIWMNLFHTSPVELRAKIPCHAIPQKKHTCSRARPVFVLPTKIPTLPETNSSHLKIGHPKRKLLFQPSIFRGYVSFRESSPLKNSRKSVEVWTFKVMNTSEKTGKASQQFHAPWFHHLNPIASMYSIFTYIYPAMGNYPKTISGIIPSTITSEFCSKKIVTTTWMSQEVSKWLVHGL